MNFTDKIEGEEEISLRKSAHIEFAQKSQTISNLIDPRFNYEPLFVKFPQAQDLYPTSFLDFSFDFPFWISSMTGGTEHAKKINQNLASLCQKYNLGMGLGSCRSLLYGNERIEDFAVRKLIGDRPLFANIGIAQLENLVLSHKVHLLTELLKKLEANGLFIHINPLQEWFQPEGDCLKLTPLETLQRFLDQVDFPVIVKEVGQGIGPKSIKALLELPVEGIEFAAFGGTNFSLLENTRRLNIKEIDTGFIKVGHSIVEMIEIINKSQGPSKALILSGGVKSPLDAYYYLKKCKSKALVGMANLFLTPALQGEEALFQFFEKFKNSFLMASQILEVRGEE